MKQREIDAIKPGRDLDGIIAERFFGYRREPVPKDGKGENGGGEMLVPSTGLSGFELPRVGPVHFAYMAPQYSTDLGRAFELVVCMLGRGWMANINPTDPQYGPVLWRCQFWNLKHKSDDCWESLAQSLPHAICLAAIKVAESLDTKGAKPQ